MADNKKYIHLSMVFNNPDHEKEYREVSNNVGFPKY